VAPPLIVGDMTSLCEATDRCTVRCPQQTSWQTKTMCV